MQQNLAAAYISFCIRYRFHQQQFTDFLLCNGFALFKFLQFLYVFITVKSYTLPLASITPGSTRFLIIPSKDLGMS